MTVAQPETAKYVYGVVRSARASPPKGAGIDDERIRVGEWIAAALDEKRGAAAPGIIDRVAPFAGDVRVGEPVHERMAVNASFLVERARLGEFDRVVDQIGAELAGRIQLKYTGPLPPHSFVELGAGV